MFNKEDIEKYQNITPSEDLKKRVMATYEQGKEVRKPSSLYKQISLIAACFVLVIVGAVFVTTESAEIKLYTNGKVVSENLVNLDEYGIGLASERSVSDEKTVVYLETEAFLKSQVSVSKGEISVFSKDTGELLTCGKECLVKGNVSIQWSVEKEKTDNAEIKISNALEEEVFILDYNHETEQTSIKKKN